MRWTALVAAAFLVGTGVLTAASTPAEAQRRGARSVEEYPGSRYDRAGRRTRAPARITVRRGRSFLDPGTTVAPFSRQYMEYALPRGYYPFQVVGGAATPAGFQNPSWPAPGRFHPWPP
jgi:hypothetical protein